MMARRRLMHESAISSSQAFRHREPSITKGLWTLPRPEVAAHGETLPSGLVMCPEPNARALGLRSKGGRR